MYTHKKINKSKKRKQKKSRKIRKTKKQTKKQRKYLGGDEVYTPTDPEEMQTTIMFYNKNGWNDEIMKNSPQYKGPIGGWNVSNIKDMSMMFFGCATFNESLNDWDVSNVENMSSMFENCRWFNKPLNNWNVSKVKNMSSMFFACHNFDQPLDNWDVSNVESMARMFDNCTSFNKPLNNWNVSNVKYMSRMFTSCNFFDQPLDNWDVSNVRDMTFMFFNCSDFSKNLDNWTTKLTNLQEMKDIFYGCHNFDKEHFIRKFYQESFETDDELYKMFIYDNIFFLIITYNKYNIENFTICHAIYLYNRVFDNYTNGILRNDNKLKKTLTPKLLEFLEKIIHTIDDYFINKAPISYEGMKLYRGERELCEGDTCRMGVISSYTSTSKDANVVYNFTNKFDCCLYIYVLEEGIPYIDVDELMKTDYQSLSCGTELQLRHHDEHEVILPRGITLDKIKVLKSSSRGKIMGTFIMSISWDEDENYIENNTVNF